MAVTAAQIARLRRMVAEPDASNDYTDVLLTTYIEENSLLDIAGRNPDNDDWVDTYDLNGAAASIWTEKASSEASKFDSSADGGDFKFGQKYKNARLQANHFSIRKSPRVVVLTKYPHGKTNEDVECSSCCDSDLSN